MCGISGYAGFHDRELLARMNESIFHRGPDSDGMAVFPEEKMAIGMRRLAIIDISGGEQPFVSSDQRVHLVFNGEIYNHRELRSELEKLGYKFRTQSDTEVLLAAYLEWGEKAWLRLSGMFVIAVIDRRAAEPVLLVIRDHVGIKPLYFAQKSGKFVFASEVKALLLWGGLSLDIDLKAISDYLALRYVPGNGSMFQDIKKLGPGCQASFRAGVLTISRWWAPPSENAQAADMSRQEAKDVIATAMRSTIASHMISDVPVGAFLSGGIDSNVIVALMAELSSQAVKTFSIGFKDFPDDDRRLATVTAKHFGTDHHEIDCTAEDFQSLSDIAWHLDEPIGDAIVVPMYVLAREARKSVQVVLSGEGADEMFGGYMFHRKLVQMARLQRYIPGLAWEAAACLISILPPALLNKLFDYPGELGHHGRTKIAMLLRSLRDNDLGTLYRKSISLFDSQDIQQAALNPLLSIDHNVPAPPDMGSGSDLQRLVMAQYSDWLPDDILMKADKMTMAHSLEGRVPYMDKAVISAAAQIPDCHKLSKTGNKQALRDFASDVLPRNVVNAPKRAFYVPLESYIQNESMKDLMNWALDPVRIAKRHLIDTTWLQAQREAKHDAGFLPMKRLFSIVMLELWFERFCPSASWR